MAAPSAPSGWVWVDDTNELRTLRPGVNMAHMGFIDTSGTWVVIHDSNNDNYNLGIGYSYSTDQGATWTEPAQSPFDFDAIQGDEILTWWDPDNDLLIVVYENSSNVRISALTWNKGAKTFTSEASGQIATLTSGLQAGDMVCGYSGTDLYCCFLWRDLADTNWFVQTAIYDTATPGWSGINIDNIAIDPSGDHVALVPAAAANTNPKQIANPTSDTFYAFWGRQTEVLVSDIAWNGSFSEFRITSQVQIEPGLTDVSEVLAVAYNPDQSRWYIGSYTTTGDKLNVLKSSSSDPQGLWTTVFDSDTDDGGPWLDIQSSIGHGAFDRATETLWFGTSVVNGSWGSNEGWVIYEYDVVADTWTRHEAKFGSAYSADSLDSFFPWDGNVTPIGFMAQLDVGLFETYVMSRIFVESSAGGGGGIGFWV